MKTKKLVVSLFLLAVFGIVGCSESDDKPAIRTDITRVSFQTGELTQQVSFTTDAAWTALSTETWLSVTPASGAAGTVTLTLTASVNDKYDDRKAVLRIKAGETVREIPVAQSKKGALIVSQKVYNDLAFGGDTVVVTLQSNLDYSANIVEGESWIKEIGGKALTEKEWKFIVEANDKADARTGKIVFKDQNSLLSDTVTIHQNGNTDVEITLPDPAFRRYCLDNFDKNVDGRLTLNEVDTVTVLTVTELNIESLEGIGYFTGLERLTCYRNNLKQLDLSKNTRLSYFNANLNLLESLDLSGNRELVRAEFEYNKLKKLSVDLPKLLFLDCGGNELTELTLSGDMPLNVLWCSMNQLTDLDVTSFPDLTELVCLGNQLTELNVSKNPKLRKINCVNNPLKKIRVWTGNLDEIGRTVELSLPEGAMMVYTSEE